MKERLHGSQGMIELARTYYKWHGPRPRARLANADDLADRSLMKRRDSTRGITIDAVEHFFTRIIEKRPFTMAKDAAERTPTAILGRMAYETKREAAWDEMMRSARGEERAGYGSRTRLNQLGRLTPNR